MNYNHEAFQTQPVSYGLGKIDAFQLKSYLKQKSYLCPLNNDSNIAYVSNPPQRKRQILKIINPDTGDNIFSEIEKAKPPSSFEENVRKEEGCTDDIKGAGGNVGAEESLQKTNTTSAGPCSTSDSMSVSAGTENVNNNRAILPFNTDPNSLAVRGVLQYAPLKDSFASNIPPQKFATSMPPFHNMYYNQPFYPLPDHLPPYHNLQRPPPQHFLPQSFMYPYRNVPFYNNDVCYYPPMSAQVNTPMTPVTVQTDASEGICNKGKAVSSQKTINNSSNESLAETRTEDDVSQAALVVKATTAVEVEEKADESGTRDEATDASQNTEGSSSSNKELKSGNAADDKSLEVCVVAGETTQQKNNASLKETQGSAEDADVSATAPKHLDPNAKSFIFNGILLPPLNYLPEGLPSRRSSNSAYNMHFGENDRWIGKGCDKGHVLLHGVASNSKLQTPEEDAGEARETSKSSDELGSRNKSGRIQYSREFLLSLQYEPDSLKIPKDTIIYPEIIQTGLHPHHMRVRMNKQQQCLDFNHSHFHNNNNHSNPLLTDKTHDLTGIRSGSMSMPSVIEPCNKVQQLNNHALMMLLNNNIQQHGRHIKGKPLQQQQQQLPRKVIQVSLEKDVQLHHSNNAWKPSQKFFVSSSDVIRPDESAILDLYKKVRSILNKLTPQKFDTLIRQVHDLSINTEEKLKGCIKLIFEKAIGEPSFSLAYAKMAKSLNNLKVHMDGQPGETVTFRKLLLNQCQREFEKDKAEQQDLHKMSILIDEATSEKDRQQLIEAKQGAEKLSKRRSLGNIRFIGELFRLKMLTENIMYECISRLLRFSDDEDNVECLCRLLTTIGYDLEHTSSQCKQRLDKVFEEVKILASKSELSSRVRFLLQDVLELRQNSWAPRRNDIQPKTIEQIHREAELEQRSCHLVQEKRSPTSVQRFSVPIQKRGSLDHLRGNAKPLVSRGRLLQVSKEEEARTGQVRAVVGCGSNEKAAPNHSDEFLAKKALIKSRGSLGDIHKQVGKACKGGVRKSLEKKTCKSLKDVSPFSTKGLSGSISVDSLVTAPSCKPASASSHPVAQVKQ